MTNKQAIEKLNDIRCHVKETSTEEQALVMAINALEAQLSQEDATIVAKSKRTFVELLVHYPHPDVCTYPEYKGKPYYSIKYIEDGECFVGFGTYKPEVLSQYLRDYFMPSAQPERKTGHWIAPKYYPTQFTFTCSKCGYKQSFNGKFKFCPNCGADMRGEQE